MSSDTAGDMSLTQDEDVLRKMWQETDDFGKKKEIRSHMYKVREARLKDFYNAGEETSSTSESRQHFTTTTSTKSGTTGIKGSDLMTHADNLADHSFLSLKSKEIRDSESPTKDSYKITESRKINDRDWNIMECNEASKDGKKHTTLRVATTSGKQDVDGGELNYAAKSEQKASVYKDGDDKNFTKAVEASSQNVIKQEAFGGDDNSKFYSTSTSSTASSKFTTEHRSTTDDSANFESTNVRDTRSKIISSRDGGDRIQKIIAYDESPTITPPIQSSQTVVRKVYTENIPTEFKNHPSYIDGNTKVTTETKTLPDGSTITTTRYETKGATQYSTSATSSSTTSSSKKQVTSSEKTSSNISKSHVTNEDVGKIYDDRSINVIDDSRTGGDVTIDKNVTVIKSQQLDAKSHHDKSDSSTVRRSEVIEKRYVDESDIQRIQDASLIGRDVRNVQSVDTIVKSHDVPIREAQTTTTVTRNVETTYQDRPTPSKDDFNSNVVVRTYSAPVEDVHTTTTRVTKKISSNYDKQKVASTDFLNTERQQVTETKTSSIKVEDVTPIEIEIKPSYREIKEVTRVTEETIPISPKTKPSYEQPNNTKPKPRDVIEIEILPNKEQPKKDEPKYEQPERRQPIKPGKSEFDEKPLPTDGQYDTTYRTDYIPRRISVEVSPTHDTFARSLRSISPDRLSKTGSIRSIRTTSTTSLRSTNSPDRYPSKPSRRSPQSPTKKSSKSPEKYSDVVTKKRPESPEKKSPITPQRTVNKYIEDDERITRQVKESSQVVNSDTITRKKKTTTTKTEVDSSTLTKKKPTAERPRSRSASPTSVASDIEFIRHTKDVITDLDIDETNRRSTEETKLIRRHTEKFDQRPTSLDTTPTKKPQRITDKSATIPLTESPTKRTPTSPSKDFPKSKSPTKEPVESPVDKGKPRGIRRTDTYQQRCEEILGISDTQRKPSLPGVPKGPESPTKPKKFIETDSVKPKDTKSSLSTQEPQSRKPKGSKETAPVEECPSQIRKSPTKEAPGKQPLESRKDTKPKPSVQEFPSQIRKPSEKIPLEPYPERTKGDKQAPTVEEFPSQVRRSPQREPLEAYSQRPKADKRPPSVQEFPSQIRKPTEKEPLEPCPEKLKSDKQPPSVQEFPSQIRKSPVKEPLEPYPEKPSSYKQPTSVQEFPSQVKKSPAKEPLEPYPEKPRSDKQAPSVQEFPSQVRKPLEKEPLEPYPDRSRSDKQAPSVQEFPSQIRKASEKEPLEPYPEKPRSDKQAPSVQEFPSQVRKPSEKEPLEPYPDRPRSDKQAPSVQEFPSQIRKASEKEALEPYTEKPRSNKQAPSVQEFPSQVRKPSEKEPLEPYLERPRSDKQAPSVQEFPKQIRRSPEKESLEPYLERPTGDKLAPSEQESPSHIKKPSEKQPVDPYPEKPKSDKQAPTVQEFPSQKKKSPEKPSILHSERPTNDNDVPQDQEFPSQTRKSPGRKLLEPGQEKPKNEKQIPSVSQPEKAKGPMKTSSTIQVTKSPKKEPQAKLSQKEPEKFDEPQKDYPEDYVEEPTGFGDTPLEKSPNKVSLDDLPAIKTDKVSLDDISSVKKPQRKTPEKISLHDINYKPDKVVDSFIANEKMDTEITLEKHKDDSIHVPRGIPSAQTQTDVKVAKKKSKVTKKTKKETSTRMPGAETDSSTTEDEQDEIDRVETEIIEDICDLVECVDKQVVDEEITKVTQTHQTKKPTKEEPKVARKLTSPIKPTTKSQRPTGREPVVEDFVTVTKTQLLQTSSKVPVEEPVQTKKFISILCKDEEEDRSLKQTITSTEKQVKTKHINVDEQVSKGPSRIVKKDNPDRTGPITKSPDKKKQTELLIKKEKLDTTVKSKVDTRKMDVKGSPKKTPDENKTTITKKDNEEKRVYETEYGYQYNKKPSKSTTKVSARPTQTKKTVSQDVTSTTDTTKDAKIHIKIEKIDTARKISSGSTSKPIPVDKRPVSKRPVSPYKRLEDQQPKQPTKLKTIEVKQPRTTVKTTLQKTVEVQPIKRHVVSTIINIKPKTKPETITRTIHKTTVTRTINVPKSSNVTPKISKLKQKPILNGHVSTEEEEDDSDVEIIKETEDVSVKETTKTIRDRVTPSRRSPLTRLIDSTTDKKKSCITTKSILIENAVADEREIIVDLRRSKSSREGTPDRICPYPVTGDSDMGTPRYPDRVTEPDDGSYRPKLKRISDIPLNETERVTQFDRITEITEGTAKTTRTEVETTDECLLSVNEKVNKFLSTAEQVTKKPLDSKPAPKVERPKLEVDDDLKEDECLLSVSDKVHKFITTAEQLASSTKETLQSSRSPKYKETKPRVDDEHDLKPKDKVVPSTLLDEPVPRRKESPRDTKPEQRPQTRSSLSPEKQDHSSRPISRDEKSPDYPDSESTKYRTPERKSSDLYAKKATEEIVKIRRESFEDDGTPKTSRRLSKDEPKAVLSPTGRLRSTETIKKAKALFENIGKEPETVRQRDILGRPSVFEGRKLKKTEDVVEEEKLKDVRTRLTYDEVKRSPSPLKQPQAKAPRDRSPDEEIPHYMTPLDRTVKEHKRERKQDDEHEVDVDDSTHSRDTSPDRNIPHYMLPLDRTVRERSPHKENLKQLEDIMTRSVSSTVQSDEIDVKTTKFGVTLRRTDSGRMVSVHRKTSTSSVDRQTTDLEIEEIFDLEYLEKLLETIVGYDIRRRIRAQIRLIKRAIEENTFETLIVRRGSPIKDSPKRQAYDKDEPVSQDKRYSSTDKRKQSEEVVSHRDVSVTEVSEYKSSYKRKTSSEISSTKVKSPSSVGNRTESSSKRPKDKSLSPERKTKSVPEADQVDAKTSTSTTTTRIFQTDLKKAKPLTKTMVEEKPEWVTQRTLRKVSETSAPVKKTVTTTVKKIITREENGDVKPTDVITSSYGVGPMDENGTPLFGLKALRTQNKSEKTKVQGTVIRSQYYSEDGKEPEGEISVIKFSTDPSDLKTENVTQEKGIASVTTTQKFGYKGTPSLKTVTSKTKKSLAEDAEQKSTVKTSKVTRRGSVKEISQKFIENAVDTLKNERQSSYPKAGLILRTSSFKDTPSNDTESSREGSPATQEIRKEIVTSVETTSTTSDSRKADTFLTNKSKVTDVQDVISRMRNEEVEIEESEEDAEARNLLNKFIGSQVLLSGMESRSSLSSVTATAAPSGNLKRTTKITTTTTSSESSKPTTVTRIFTHPITAELLQTVWDEQTLKLLLEQSTDYEDRRIIRARLREVMAEQEACAELVEKASDEASIKESGSSVHGTTTTTYTEGPITTSQVTTRITNQQQQVKKPMSPFAKFRQLDKQNSLNSPPSTPKSPTGGGPLFKFTDPSLNQSANTVKQRLLQWCQMKTKEYENIQLDNFSSSWSDGMAFCALIHHFLPNTFDYNTLNPRNRRHNFTLAFRVAEEKAGIAPLLDVDDMVAISKPDWKCVFTYVQSIYRRFKDED